MALDGDQQFVGPATRHRQGGIPYTPWTPPVTSPRQMIACVEAWSLHQLRTHAARNTPDHPRGDRVGQSQNWLQYRAWFEDERPDEARPTWRALHHIVLSQSTQPWDGCRDRGDVLRRPESQR